MSWPSAGLHAVTSALTGRLHLPSLSHMSVGDLALPAGHVVSAQTAVFFGGIPIQNDIQTLETKKPHIVVGTPGRILELVRRKNLVLDKVKFFVIDECDKVLDQIGAFQRKHLGGRTGPGPNYRACRLDGARHAQGRSGYICADANQEAGDDVFRNAQQGNTPGVQEVHERCNSLASRGALALWHLAGSGRPSRPAFAQPRRSSFTCCRSIHRRPLLSFACSPAFCTCNGAGVGVRQRRWPTASTAGPLWQHARRPSLLCCCTGPRWFGGLGWPGVAFDDAISGCLVVVQTVSTTHLSGTHHCRVPPSASHPRHSLFVQSHAYLSAGGCSSARVRLRHP